MTEQPEIVILKKIINDQEKEIAQLKEENIRLKINDEQYKNLFDNTPAAITLATFKGKLIAANKTIATMTGYSIDELKKMNMQDLYETPVDRKPLIDMLKKEGALLNAPIRLKRKDGSVFNALLTLSKIHDEQNEELYQCICLDISEFDKIETEKKILQERLEQSRKLESIAVIAGGVAHQFNNALAAIVGNIELLEMKTKNTDLYSKYLDPAKKTAYRMAKLTEQLLDYARGTDFMQKSISLSGLITETLQLIKHSIKPGITVNVDIQEELPPIDGDYSKLQMALSAIISNSSEAIDATGNILITYKKTVFTKEDLKNIHYMEPGPYLELSIKDNGKGMNENTKSRIFEPFFSTKFYGNGLGMSSVYGIIKKHDGMIFVESAENKGTCVKIYFKAVKNNPDIEERDKDKSSKGMRTALLVEDEPTVMNVNQAILETLGFKVLKAKTGHEAIDIAGTFPGEIDITLLDIQLPDMDGKTVYLNLIKKRPGIRVIVCSGYSSDDLVQGIIDAGAHGFIQKPFSLKVIEDKIKAVLAN